MVWPQTVLDPGGPYWSEPGDPGAAIHRTAYNNGDVLDFSYNFTERNRGKYFNIAETLHRARAFADARRGDSDPIPQVPVQPAAAATFYNAPLGELDLAGPSTYTDLVIVHEYAHFLEDKIGSLFALPSSHDGCVATIAGVVVNSPEHAWMEGFAEWFAQAVNRRDPGAGLVGTSSSAGGTDTVQRLESPFCPSLPAGISGNAVEDFVAGSLWDPTDVAGQPLALGEPFDSLGDFDTQVLQIMDGPLDSALLGGTMPTINRFRAAWNGRGLPQLAFDTILNANHVPAI